MFLMLYVNWSYLVIVTIFISKQKGIIRYILEGREFHYFDVKGLGYKKFRHAL